MGASVVTLGGEGEVTFGSKREAKEAIAAKGVEVIRDMAVPGSGPSGAGAAGAEENWVGRLAGNAQSIHPFFFESFEGKQGYIAINPHHSPAPPPRKPPRTN